LIRARSRKKLRLGSPQKRLLRLLDRGPDTTSNLANAIGVNREKTIPEKNAKPSTGLREALRGILKGTPSKTSAEVLVEAGGTESTQETVRSLLTPKPTSLTGPTLTPRSHS